uniref:Uncharacterized protein n=1 Tax=Anopheles dirus TaxID=7168 RepID=A0A182NT19_9DIPT
MRCPVGQKLVLIRSVLFHRAPSTPPLHGACVLSLVSSRWWLAQQQHRKRRTAVSQEVNTRNGFGVSYLRTTGDLASDLASIRTVLVQLSYGKGASACIISQCNYHRISCSTTQHHQSQQTES